MSPNLGRTAGRGFPKSQSHVSEPNPTTQERVPSCSRNPTERTRADRSAQRDRIIPRLLVPGLIVTTRKIAARVSGVATGCGMTCGMADALGAIDPRLD